MRISMATKLAAMAGAAVIAAGSAATVALADSGGPVTPTANATTATADPISEVASDVRGHRAWLADKGVHGEFVARTADGFKTFEVQKGTVTAVSGSSLTVRSDDGYTVSYSVTDSTIVRRGKNKVDISTVKAGEKIVIGARVDGQTRTALRVIVQVS
ncbi:hypothetical protein [Frankia sp. CiP3]|uniref:hypothetical protein n=1 Tax=Frankia sp. CiP3 TaxID=2880971 RepID=UPI001EF41355|nr:hypothetical protein [Frankia sp. CiP3]